MTFEQAHQRIKRGDLLGIKHALDNNLDPNLKNRFSWSLLMLSAIAGNTAIGQLLLSRGAEVDAVNNFGETALSLAAHSGHLSFIELLMRADAKTNAQPHGASLADWIKKTSGLDATKIDRILAILGSN